MKSFRRFVPLLFWVFPLALFILPFFVCFKDGDYTFIAISGSQGISAASVSMYRCYGYVGGFGAVAFYFSIVLMAAAATIVTLTVFIPSLTKARFIHWVIFGCLGVSALMMIAAGFLLIQGVETATVQYFDIAGRQVEKTSGFSHADITFFLEFLLPVLTFAWWGWTMAVEHRLQKTAKS